MGILYYICTTERILFVYCLGYYRAEEIPEEEVEVLQGSELIVPVAHFHKEARSTFGVPFLIKVSSQRHYQKSRLCINIKLFQVRYGETWSSVKSRLQSKMCINDKDWSKMKVALVQQGTPTFLDKEEDSEMTVKSEHFASGNYVGPHAFNGRPWIGIEHVNKAPKRSRYSTEKAIKIYN